MFKKPFAFPCPGHVISLSHTTPSNTMHCCFAYVLRMYDPFLKFIEIISIRLNLSVCVVAKRFQCKHNVHRTRGQQCASLRCEDVRSHSRYPGACVHIADTPRLSSKCAAAPDALIFHVGGCLFHEWSRAGARLCFR